MTPMSPYPLNRNVTTRAGAWSNHLRLVTPTAYADAVASQSLTSARAGLYLGHSQAGEHSRIP